MNKVIEKPQPLDKLLCLAKILSENTTHIRVDFYVINERIHFGELTFFHESGMKGFTPEEWDKKLGDWIDLDLAYSKKR